MTIFTYGDLIKGATSSNAEERKRAWAVFQTWKKKAPQLSPDQRLGYAECYVLTKIFAEKGFGVERPTTRRRA